VLEVIARGGQLVAVLLLRDHRHHSELADGVRIVGIGRPAFALRGRPAAHAALYSDLILHLPLGRPAEQEQERNREGGSTGDNDHARAEQSGKHACFSLKGPALGGDSRNLVPWVIVSHASSPWQAQSPTAQGCYNQPARATSLEG